MAIIGRWNIARPLPPVPFRCVVLEFVIEQAAFCALIGFVLSIVVTMAASRPVRVKPQGILAMAIIAAGACGGGLYCLRGWWLPRPHPDATVEHRRPATRSRQAVLLRYRVEAVVRADRRYPYGSTEGRPAKAA
jgi:hypothetical protein